MNYKLVLIVLLAGFFASTTEEKSIKNKDTYAIIGNELVIIPLSKKDSTNFKEKYTFDGTTIKKIQHEKFQAIKHLNQKNDESSTYESEESSQDEQSENNESEKKAYTQTHNAYEDTYSPTQSSYGQESDNHYKTSSYSEQTTNGTMHSDYKQNNPSPYGEQKSNYGAESFYQARPAKKPHESGPNSYSTNQNAYPKQYKIHTEYNHTNPSPYGGHKSNYDLTTHRQGKSAKKPYESEQNSYSTIQYKSRPEYNHAPARHASNYGQEINAHVKYQPAYEAKQPTGYGDDKTPSQYIFPQMKYALDSHSYYQSFKSSSSYSKKY